MNYFLHLAAVCEPNGGGEIGGVCQLLLEGSAPEVVKAYKAAAPENTNFLSNYFTLQKGLERFAELVRTYEDKAPILTIYTNADVLVKQMQGKYQISRSSYQLYADACLDILSGVYGLMGQTVNWEKIPHDKLNNALIFARKIIRENQPPKL